MRCLVLVLPLLLACSPASRPDPAPSALYVSGDLRGYLEPCGCNRPQLGGLPRRGTALAGAPFVENGGLVSGPGRLNEIKFETLLVALGDLGCRALNVGAGELSLGLDFLRSAEGLAPFPLISANVLDESGRRAFRPGIFLSVGGAHWRVFGAVDAASVPGRPVAPAAEALRQALRERPRSRPYRTVLLFSGPREAAEDLLRAHRGELDLVVYSSSDGDARIDPGGLVTPGDRGRRLLRVAPSPHLYRLGEEFRDDPRMVARISEYVRRILSEDLLHRMNPEVEPAGGGYTGDAACGACHAADSKLHEATRHARAIESLRRTGREVDPDCVSCHVVGYGERTGFTSMTETPALTRVGCESCHGAGADHAANPKVRTGGRAREACFRCHTEDTDPGFRFEKRWEDIRHGGR